MIDGEIRSKFLTSSQAMNTQAQAVTTQVQAMTTQYMTSQPNREDRPHVQPNDSIMLPT